MFKSGIVLHYVKENTKSQRKEIFNEIKDAIENKTLLPDLSTKNNFLAIKNLINQLPVGSIICKNLTKNINQTIICFPMFSSHVSLPIKPGEEVWYFTDSESDFTDEYATGAPILGIKNYWLSRKIGAKISEDLNFTHIQRNALITDLKPNIDLERNQVRIPDFKNKKLYNERYRSVLPNVESIYIKAKEEKSIYPSSVPRWNSKPYELTLQGSNNSLINLTKNEEIDEVENIGKGAIDIVAGRHALENYTAINDKGSNIVRFSVDNIKNLNNKNTKYKSYSDTIYLSDSIKKIKNSCGEEELLKDTEYYLNQIEKGDHRNEGEVNRNLDASRIYVSEMDKVDNKSYFDISYLSKQKSITSDQVISNSLKKNYLFEENTINFNNKESINLSDKNKVLPTIFLKTNNLRLIARKQTSNEFQHGHNNNTLDEGSIRLIKESNNFNNYSHLLLEDNGDILVDGKSIYIGNFNKELLRKDIIQDLDKPLVRKNLNETELANLEKKIDKMKGNGSSVFIGYDPEYSEPLVLGESLKTIITELINLNISLADELEKISTALENHVHTGIPNAGISKGPANKDPYKKYNTKAHKNLTSRYKNVRDNLKDILSKFAKTS